MNGKLVSLSKHDGIDTIVWSEAGIVWRAENGIATEISNNTKELEASLLRLAQNLDIPTQGATISFKNQTIRVYKESEFMTIVFMTKGHWFMKSLNRSVRRALHEGT